MAQIEESVARYLQQLDSADRQEPSEALTTKTTPLEGEDREAEGGDAASSRHSRRRCCAAPDQQISLTDPDARSMATSGRGSGVVGYNVQVAVETEHHLIVTHEVTNVGTDRSQLAHVAKETKATLEAENLDAVADRGYFNSEEILACEEAGITVTLPKPMTSNAKAEGRFGKQDFRYMAEEDVYICPAGERLSLLTTRTKKTAWSCAATATDACQSCAIKHSCTTGKERRITRWEHEHVLEAVQRRLDEHPGKDAPAARDGRASLRHDQGADGRNPLPDEDAATGRHRNGAARARLQSHPRHEHHGRPTAHGGDEGIIAADTQQSAIAEPPRMAGILISSASSPKNRQTTKNGHARPRRQSLKASTQPPRRFRTTKTHKRHWLCTVAIVLMPISAPIKVLV